VAEKPNMLEKPNIITKQILEPIVVTMVETHAKLDTIDIEIHNQMAIIQI
jgi:hypothetical protein